MYMHLLLDQKKLHQNLWSFKGEINAYLSHCSKESLSIEEPSHPESVWSALETPRRELVVTLYQLSEPETKSARIPRYLRKEIYRNNE